MDVWIVLSALIPVGMFLCSLCIIFRMVPEKKSIGGMFIAAGVGLLFACGFWANRAQVLHLSSSHQLIGYIYVISIYTCGVVLFLLSIFSVFEASLTVWFLSHIARTSDGMQKNELSKHYGVIQIVEKRVQRLTASGEIVCTEGRYALGRKKSYFLLREDLFALYWQLFP